MELASRYHGDDNTSMQANNTSAFNCRAVTGRPGVFSKHNYRRAIDNNTIQNPYVNGDTVLPKTESRFLDRSKRQSGLIQANGVVVQAFNKSGWKWGGNWTSLKDYQHFEKH